MSKKITLSELQPLLAEFYGKQCCRRQVGEHNSLSLGFGEKIPHGNARLVDSFYGEWELGTYGAEWRFIKSGRIICGSRELVDSADELQNMIANIELGAIAAISSSSFNVTVSLDCGLIIEFFWMSSDDDEIFHIFGPKELYIEFTSNQEWLVGRSSI